MERDDPVRVPGCRGLRATSKAVLVLTAEGQRLWIPQSLIHDDSEVWKPGDEGDLVVPEWFATREELATVG